MSSTSQAAGPVRYAELRCKTNFSFLTGAAHPAEYVGRAAELGLSAIAITDRDGVYGIPRAYRAIKEHPQLKLIVGAELTLAGGLPPLSFLARDRQAYGLLCRILTAAHADKPKGEASLDWEALLRLLERPGREGLFVLPEIPLQSSKPLHDLGVLRDIFGPRLFLPLSRLLDGNDKKRTRRALELSRQFDIPIVATNDVHYHEPRRRALQDVMTAIRHGTTLERAGTKLFPNAERYLKSPEQMAALFKDMPEALTRTFEIAEACTFSPSELRYYYPSEWIPAGHSAQSFLEELVWKGAASRYPSWNHPKGVPEEVRKQLLHELKLIEELKFADYFLTIWEIVEFARDRNILCQGRGSAANSAVCYCLGITAIDPVRMNLLFERFISVERGEPPDIDVDFEHERREEVIQHLYEKYGRDRAAMVSAVITYRSRSALREVKKALGLDPAAEPENEDAVAKVEKLSDELYGFPRHLSIHSGGFTLSRDPLIEVVPIEPARMEGRTIIQWDKDDLDAIGLLKVDVLALGMLTAIHKACDLSGLTLAAIPPEDPETYKMIQKADTVGTFQIESRAQMNMLGRLLPERFYDLVIQVAIVRPGPIVGKMIHPYLRRRRGLEPVEMPHPKLRPILRKTLGVPIFQEQIMKIAVALAGFTAGEADELRRAIGAWRSSGSIEKVGRKLMEGLLKSGLPREWVERVFEQIKGFAEYGFPESHAASFALLAYASAYLKCHHPAEFCCALLNSQPMGFYAPHSLVDDAKRHDVVVLPVHPNKSDWDTRLVDKPVDKRGIYPHALQLGWRVVKGLGEKDAKTIVEERKKRDFSDLADFCSRVRLMPAVMHRLAMGGAFSCFGLDQRHALWELLACQLILQPDGEEGQLSLFSGQELIRGRLGANSEDPAPLFTPLDDLQSIHADYASYGLSTRGHPMQALRQKMRRLPRATTATARRLKHGDTFAIAGLSIVRQRPPTAAGTVFATLEDEEGLLDLIFHKEVFERYEDLLDSHAFLVAEGVVQRDRHSISLLVRRVRAVWADEVPAHTISIAPVGTVAAQKGGEVEKGLAGVTSRCTSEEPHPGPDSGLAGSRS